MKQVIKVTQPLWHSVYAGLTASLFCLGLAPAYAGEHEEEATLAESEIFFELNNTDGDLGIHGLIDGDAWKRLRIEDHNERTMLDIHVKSRLRKQGLTEIFFESAEPPFESDDPEDVTLAPAEFFARFPAGTYEVETITTEGEEQEGEAEITHIMPAPPVIKVNGEAAAEDCDSVLPEIPAGDVVTISWEPVTEAHPDLGADLPVGEVLDIVNYEVVVEIDETPYRTSTILPSDATEFVVPNEILELTEGDGEVKFEVLVREASYNQTAVESCFAVAP